MAFNSSLIINLDKPFCFLNWLVSLKIPETRLEFLVGKNETRLTKSDKHITVAYKKALFIS
jgi:hypothetical protein